MTTAKARYISPDTIEDLAHKILVDAKLDIDEPGAVDVIGLTNFFSCSVERVDFDNTNVAAMIEKDNSGHCLIQVANKDDGKRQRFSIAHEISHLVLHDDAEFIEFRKPLTAYNNPEMLYKEVQANMLAAALLMPKELVMRAWKNSKDVGDLASIFNVSPVTAYYRLDNLGLLNGEQAY